jgi:hypothetical protein
MGITFKNSGAFRRHNSDKPLRPINGEYIAEVTECSYCRQIIHNGVFLIHVRDCPKKVISKNMTIKQQKDEITIYIFKLVPEFSDYISEYCYFLKRGINYMTFNECSAYTIKLYLAIRKLKKRRMVPCTEFSDLDVFPPYIYEQFSSLFFATLKEGVTLINGFDVILHEFGYTDQEWIDSKDAIPSHLWNGMEDGFYRTNYFRNWEI